MTPEECVRKVAGPISKLGGAFMFEQATFERGAALGMDPWAYFRDVLPKLGDTRFPASRLAELLPESWAQQQAQQR